MKFQVTNQKRRGVKIIAFRGPVWLPLEGLYEKHFRVIAAPSVNILLIIKKTVIQTLVHHLSSLFHYYSLTDTNMILINILTILI